MTNFDEQRDRSANSEGSSHSNLERRCLSCAFHLKTLSEREKFLQRLEPNYFFNFEHRALFQDIRIGFIKNKPIEPDFLVSSSHLKREFKENSRNCLAFIAEVMNAHEPFNTDHWQIIDALKENFIRKVLAPNLRHKIEKLEQSSSEEIECDLMELCESSRDALQKSAFSKYDNDLKPQDIEGFEERCREHPPSVTSDLSLGGYPLTFPCGKFSLIAAATHHGKTLFLKNIALSLSRVNPEKSIYYFTLEQRQDDIHKHLLNTFCNLSLVSPFGNIEAIDNFYHHGKELAYIRENRDEFVAKAKEFDELLKSGKLHIIGFDLGHCDRSIEDLEMRIMSLADDSSEKVVIIDYAQEIEVRSPNSNALHLDHDKIARRLDIVAQRSNLPIIVAAQLNRDGDSESAIGNGNISHSIEYSRKASQIIVLYNRSLKPKIGTEIITESGHKIPPVQAIFARKTKDRSRAVTHLSYDVFAMNSNTGVITNSAKLMDEERKRRKERTDENECMSENPSSPSHIKIMDQMPPGPAGITRRRSK